MNNKTNFLISWDYKKLLYFIMFKSFQYIKSIDKFIIFSLFLEFREWIKRNTHQWISKICIEIKKTIKSIEFRHSIKKTTKPNEKLKYPGIVIANFFFATL